MGRRTYRIVRSLEKPENDVVYPKIPEMMIADRICPDSDHAIPWNQDREDIGDHEHCLCSSKSSQLSTLKEKDF